MATTCERLRAAHVLMKRFPLLQLFTQVCLCAASFADRGAGSSAVKLSPPRSQAGTTLDAKKACFAGGEESLVVPALDGTGVAGDAGAPRVQKRGEGITMVGLVSVDPQRGRISFPAKVNQRSGLVEYAVVTSKGKVHESVFVTEAAATHIHVAALLLKLAPSEGQTEPVKLAVEVEWQQDGSARRESLERLIVHAKDAGAVRAGSTLSPEAWHYAGPALNEGALVAETEGSVVALITDAAALIQNPRAGRVDDELHAPNSDSLPGQGSPVVVHLLPFKDKKTE